VLLLGNSSLFIAIFVSVICFSCEQCQLVSYTATVLTSQNHRITE